MKTIREEREKMLEKGTNRIYRGLVIDQLNEMPTRYTHYYPTYAMAYNAAKNLCKRTMRDRGRVDVDYGPEPN